MEEQTLAIFIAIFSAFCGSALAKAVRIPRVVGQIFAGLLLGYFAISSGFLTRSGITSIGVIADIGIILMFFFVGLELDMSKLKKSFSMSASIALFDTIVPFILGFLAARFAFGLSLVQSTVVGICISVCAEAVALDILEELKLLKTKLSALIISAATLDDIPELILLGCMVVLFGVHIEKTSPATLAAGLIFFGIFLIAFRFIVIPVLLALVEKDKSAVSLFSGALILVAIMAYVSDILPVGTIVGSLTAGILVRQTLLSGKKKRPWEEHEIAKGMHIIAFGLFIPVFFVSVGLNTSIGIAHANPFQIIVFLLLCIVGTIAGTVLGVVIAKGKARDGLSLGWAFIPKGDTELVIATIAFKSGLIGEGLYSVIVVVAVLSTLIATMVFRKVAMNWKSRARF